MKRPILLQGLFVAVLPVAFVSGLLVRPSQPARSDPIAGSVDVVFVRDMAVHHAQAVDMSERIRQRSTDPKLLLLATDIVLTQQNQIGRFAGWLEQWDLPISAPVIAPGEVRAGTAMAGMSMNTETEATDTAKSGPGHSAMPGMATNAAVQSISTLPVAEAEQQFLKLMIAHHQGGVTMAKSVLRHTKRRDVERIASSIVGGQQSEIQTMTAMLRARTNSVAK